MGVLLIIHHTRSPIGKLLRFNVFILHFSFFTNSSLAVQDLLTNSQNIGVNTYKIHE